MRFLLLLLASGCAFISDDEFAARKDFDGDGATAVSLGGDDCDDARADIRPSADEVCDGIDNNCDGMIDDDAVDAPVWYADPDGDGYGGAELAACSVPDGYVSISGDCDNGNASINPEASETWYDGADGNCDGASDFDQDGDGVDRGDDCDDEDPGILPGAAEIWYDDVDQDCSGTSDFDQDGDGVDQGVDCDDLVATTRPGADDEWYDGIDSDCAGNSDFDSDGDTFDTLASGGTDCDDGDALAYPGAAELCDLVDADCDGETADDESVDAETWYADLDGDGFGDLSDPYNACVRPSGRVADSTDCDDGDDTVGHVTWYADVDGDFYGDPSASVEVCEAPLGYVADDSDCDDTSAAISPAAAEKCDAYNADEDCDGLSDDDDASVTGLFTYYADSDGDRYGDAGSTARQCERPALYVTNTTDCDDSDNAVNPGETEVCDSLDVDEDCDGVADDDDASVTGQTTYYVDADGDGYGSGGARSSCDALVGYATNEADCDDTDTSVSPASGDCDIPLSSADAFFIGERPYDLAGASVAGGDANGDGLDDILIGAYANTDGGAQAGAAYLLVSPQVGDVALSAASYDLLGEVGDGAGYAVAMGDVNADGTDDAIIGSPNADSPWNSGCVYVATSFASGSASLSGSTAILTGAADGRTAGSELKVFDVDSDGSDDLLVGDSSASIGSRVSSGAVYYLRSPFAGSVDLSLIAAATLAGEAAADASAAGGIDVEDIDGDGVADLVTGAPFEGATNAGAVYLVMGPLSGTIDLSSADAKVAAGAAADGAGSSVGVGDIDGDGTREILMGATRAGGAVEGELYVINGAISGSVSVTTALATIVGENESDGFGSAVAAMDMNLDGTDDVLVGAYYAGPPGSAPGAIYVFDSLRSGTIDAVTADLKLSGEADADFVGANIAHLDADADLLPDLLLGAYGQRSGGTMAGAAYLILGSSL